MAEDQSVREGHSFESLYEGYEDAIGRIKKDEFTSHEFILALAQENQKAYVEALYAHRADDAPFQAVHRVLAQGLLSFPELVEKIGEVESEDIFRTRRSCTFWRKVRKP